jgi:hypothetical protein
MELYLKDGTPLEARESLTWWQKQGLSYTATGYGRKIPTIHMVRHDNRWKRVYCCVFSNIGTLFIMAGGIQLIID